MTSADLPSVTIASDQLALELLARGASVRRLKVGGVDGTRRNVVLGYTRDSDYGLARHFLGATIGRYANRIRNGAFVLDGRQYRIPPNEGVHVLHGGADGFDKRDWRVTETSSDAATFALHSPDGDGGFPGALTVELTWTVTGSEVRMEFTAETDAPTVVSLTNHTYFNLDGEANGSIDEHTLAVAADHYTPTDRTQIPTGVLEPVEGSPFDWRAPKVIGSAIRTGHPQLVAAHGLDHNFALNGTGFRPVATLRSAGSGITLDVHTDQPGLQVYTGNYFDGSTLGTSGTLYRQGAGIALETQAFPDSPNQPAFPTAVLRPGTVYSTSTVWRFTVG